MLVSCDDLGSVDLEVSQHSKILMVSCHDIATVSLVLSQHSKILMVSRDDLAIVGLVLSQHSEILMISCDDLVSAQNSVLSVRCSLICVPLLLPTLWTGMSVPQLAHIQM